MKRSTESVIKARSHLAPGTINLWVRLHIGVADVDELPDGGAAAIRAASMAERDLGRRAFDREVVREWLSGNEAGGWDRAAVD